MPRYDVIALDIDGTLLTSDKSIREDDREAVRAAHDAGAIIALCTARPPRSSRPILEALGVLDSASVTINYNGALTWDHAARAAIDHHPIEPELALEVVERARRMEPDVHVWVEILDRWCTDRYEPHAMTIPGTETSKTHGPDRIAPLREILAQPATKIMFLHEPRRLAPMFGEFTLRYALGSRLACKVSDAHLFAVCSHRADKGVALRELCERRGVPRERVLAIGDAPNDAHMLQWAGLGLAVANAWDEAKAAADETLPLSNDEGAVAFALRREGLC